VHAEAGRLETKGFLEEHTMKRTRIAFIAAVGVMLATTALSGWAPAYAKPVPGDGAGAAGDTSSLLVGTIVADPSVRVREGPGLDSTVIGTVPNGGIYGVVCYRAGNDDISGWGGTNPNWDLLVDFGNDQVVGFAPDVWIDTYGDISGQVRQCTYADTPGIVPQQPSTKPTPTPGQRPSRAQ
jgi:hypothetical protein